MKILNIISGIKGEDSVSTKLANAITQKLQAAHNGSTVKVYDLAKNPLPHLEADNFVAFHTPAEERTAEQQGAVHYSDTAISDLMEADAIVIAVPLYNFSIPSTLKSWVDHVARAGVTFSYDENGPKGLVTGKKVYLAFASGAVYSEGPMSSFDSAEPYLRNVLGFMGMTDITTFRAEGIKVPGMGEHSLPKALDTVNEFAF
jgi:FMN-dependent NADH-azoreductase